MIELEGEISIKRHIGLMAYKTTKLKFNQGRKRALWDLLVSELQLEITSSVRLCEKSTDKKDKHDGYF